MRVRNIIVLCVLCMVTGSVGTGFFFIGSARRQDSRIAELQRSAEDLQRTHQRTMGELTERYNSLVATQSATKHIIESMGSQLETDGTNLDSATGLYKALQSTLENLRMLYTRVDSDGHSNRESNVNE